MSIPKILIVAALAFASVRVGASEYLYRDLMGNTLPPQKCATQADAERNATDAYTLDKYAKRFCETQGYGWYVSEQKSAGKLVCEPCASPGAADKYKCHVEDITVSCKRLKPGTAGLIPGKS